MRPVKVEVKLTGEVLVEAGAAELLASTGADSLGGGATLVLLLLAPVVVVVLVGMATAVVGVAVTDKLKPVPAGLVEEEAIVVALV